MFVVAHLCRRLNSASAILSDDAVTIRAGEEKNLQSVQ